MEMTRPEPENEVEMSNYGKNFSCRLYRHLTLSSFLRLKYVNKVIF